jgi:hypothetical protein
MMGALLFTVASAGGAHASTLTFDDIGIGGHIPDGYGGLQWGAFAHYLTATDNPAFFADSGYENGVVSGDFIAYNNSDQVFSVSGPAFDFNSAYLTAAWNTGLNITVSGLLGATTLYSQTVVVNTAGPTLFTFHFLGIDVRPGLARSQRHPQHVLALETGSRAVRPACCSGAG